MPWDLCIVNNNVASSGASRSNTVYTHSFSRVTYINSFYQFLNIKDSPSSKPLEIQRLI